MAAQRASSTESTEILSMFPTFVWQTRLVDKVYIPLNEQIIHTLSELADSSEESTGQWQSDQRLHEREEFQPLISCVMRTADSVMEFLKIGHEGHVITGCWANISARGTGHKIHSHPNNFLSGVYYVRAPEGADTINFHDPRSQTGIIRPPVKQLTNENTDQVVVKVSDGMFLLFPSWLEHSVDASQSDEKRISVSFNIMFSNYTESMSQPLW